MSLLGEVKKFLKKFISNPIVLAATAYMIYRILKKRKESSPSGDFKEDLKIVEEEGENEIIYDTNTKYYIWIRNDEILGSSEDLEELKKMRNKKENYKEKLNNLKENIFDDYGKGITIEEIEKKIKQKDSKFITKDKDSSTLFMGKGERYSGGAINYYYNNGNYIFQVEKPGKNAKTFRTSSVNNIDNKISQLMQYLKESYKEGKISYTDADVGNSALLKSNKLGLIIKRYGRKFHLKFPDGTEKTYDANDIESYYESYKNESYKEALEDQIIAKMIKQGKSDNEILNKLKYSKASKKTLLDVIKHYRDISKKTGSPFRLESYKERLNSFKEDIFNDRQKKIAIDTIKNPSKALLGGPSVDEAIKILKTKFKYTDDMIKKIQKESYKEALEDQIIAQMVKQGKSDNEILNKLKYSKASRKTLLDVIKHYRDISKKTGSPFRLESYKEKLIKLKEASGSIEVDGKKVDVELSGSGKKATDINNGQTYIKKDNKWYKESYKEKLNNLKESSMSQIQTEINELLQKGKQPNDVKKIMKSKYPALSQTLIQDGIDNYFGESVKKDSLNILKEKFKESHMKVGDVADLKGIKVKVKKVLDNGYEVEELTEEACKKLK